MTRVLALSLLFVAPTAWATDPAGSGIESSTAEETEAQGSGNSEPSPEGASRPVKDVDGSDPELEEGSDPEPEEGSDPSSDDGSAPGSDPGPEEGASEGSDPTPEHGAEHRPDPSSDEDSDPSVEPRSDTVPTAASSPNEVSEPAQNPTEAAATTKVSVNSTFTNDLEIRYWRVPDRLDGYEDREVLNYFEQVDRFTAHVSTDSGWQAFAQVDQVMLTANAYKLDGVYTKERTLRGPDLWWVGPERWDVYVNPEKLYIGKKSGNVTWRVGDFYEAFGYGAALNVNRNVDIDIDTSIQGARLFWQPGAWDVTILGGQLNRQQVFQDNPNIGLRGDLRHFVTGAQVKRFGLGPMNIGAHAVAYNFVDEAGISAGFSELGSPMDAVVTGASAELAASFDLNGEVDLFTHPSGQLNDEPGYLAYGSAAFYIGSTTWQLEGKRYKDAERLNSLTTPELYEVGIAPTLEYERAITEDSSATVNSNDVYGGRLRMDWSAVPGRVVPYASFAVFRDLDTAGLHFNEVPETVIHPLVGVEAVGEGVNVLLNAGYRVDMRDGGGESDRQLHGDIDFKFPVVAQTHADINAAIEYYQWGDNGALQQNDYVEMETATTFLLHEPEIAFIWYTDVTTNPLIDSKGNLADLLYGAFEIQYKPADAWTLKAFYGAYKAGIRCSGGQCRQLPGFEGGRVSVVGNF